jgi:hypothetical protein
MAYLPIHDILKSYFEIKEEDQGDIINKKLADKILQFDERLKGALPPFQELLSLKIEDGNYLHLEPAAKKIRFGICLFAKVKTSPLFLLWRTCTGSTVYQRSF